MLLRASVATAPCTSRKSTARGPRQETRWAAAALLIVRMAPMVAASRNPGRSDQKAGPKPRSRPGHSTRGRPAHEASATRAVSYRPKTAAMSEPARTPITGAQRRSVPLALSVSPQMTSKVASALSGAPSTGLPCGMSLSRLKTAGITETGISMSTVPETAGVKARRNSESLSDMRNWKSPEATTSVARVAGPPFVSASIPTAMKAAELPIMSTCPMPNRPSRNAWSIVAAPPMATAANTAHVR